MLYVSASDLSASDLALLGNNLKPARRQNRRVSAEKADRRVLSAVNRSLSSLRERVDCLYTNPAAEPLARAS